MSTPDKKKIENALAAKRAELVQTIRGGAASLALDSTEAELIDQIQSLESRDQMAIMLNRFSATLEDVERSLRAISEGCYGICAMCEEPIAARRLKIIPWAVYCVRCQERIEAEGNGVTNVASAPRQHAYGC